MRCALIHSSMLGYFEAPVLTMGHKIMGVAGLLGVLFTVLHPVTVIVTLVEEGAGWGPAAWITDVTGYITAVFFAVLCRASSSSASSEAKKYNKYILIWSAITFSVRIFDILMLFGVVKFDEIYVTPHGQVLVANVISEICVAVPYTVLAMIAAAMLLRAASIARYSLSPSLLLEEGW